MKRLLACCLCALAFQATAAAHVLDEYVQAAQIALAPGGASIELRLTPGVEVADRVFRLIDVNSDGQISPAEEQAYAQRVLQEVMLEVDGRRTPLTLTAVNFPSRREMNEGVGAIRLDLTAEADFGAAGARQLFFRNNHLPELGVYLVNALAPATGEIKISGQERDPLQREMRLSFHVTPANKRRPWLWAGVLMLCFFLALLFSRWNSLRQYLRLHGDEQIQAKEAFPERPQN